MDFLELNDLEINRDYQAREIDLITFKSILSKIQTHSNTMNNNIKYLNDIVATLQTRVASKISIGTVAPLEANIDDLWIELLL